jgi:predicted ferric reductase
MDAWKGQYYDVIDTVLRHPQTSIEFLLLLIVPLIIGSLTLGRTAATLKAKNAGIGIAVLFGTLSWATTILGIVLGRIYMVDYLSPSWHVWIDPISGVLVAILVLAPILAIMYRMSLFGAFISWALSALVTLGLILAISIGFDAFRSYGNKSEGKPRKVGATARHKAALKEVLPSK